MRVTAYMLFQQFSRNLNKNLTNLSKAQEQLSTGKRLTKPSDDVIATRGVMSYKVSINAVEQYKRNTQEGVTRLAYTETLLSSTQHVLNRARELAIPASTDSSTADERELSSYEVQNLYDQLLDIGNSKLRNKYVFSGYATSTQTFDSQGVYQGDLNDIEVYISDGIKTKINTTGNDAFTDDTKYISGDLTGETLTGNIQVKVGSGTAVYLEQGTLSDPNDTGDTFVDASPEEIRDTINAAMTDAYASTDTMGTGTLTIKAGIRDSVDLNITSSNNTLEGIRDAINGLTDPGVTAGIFEDASGQQRLFFRPTTPGEAFTVEVSDDDGNDSDTNNLSRLLHSDLQSNLTTNALGIEAFVMNGTQGKKLLFSPTTPNTDFTIEVDESNDGSFADVDDTETTAPDGLALLYQGSSSSTNLTNSVSFFTVMDNLRYSMANNDADGIRGSIHLLDGALDSLYNVTADVGSRVKYLTDQQQMLEDNKFNFEKSRSQLEDADIAKVALDVTKVQSALEALRISSMKSLTQSLIQFLN